LFFLIAICLLRAKKSFLTTLDLDLELALFFFLDLDYGRRLARGLLSVMKLIREPRSGVNWFWVAELSSPISMASASLKLFELYPDLFRDEDLN